MIESRGGWDRRRLLRNSTVNGRSSASYLNNSPKFYRPSTRSPPPLPPKIRKLGQSEDDREGVFRVNTFCPRIIRAAGCSKIDKHLARVKQLKKRAIFIPRSIIPFISLAGPLFFPFLPRFFPFRSLIFGSRVEWTKWSDETHVSLFKRTAAPLLTARRCIDACNTRG